MTKEHLAQEYAEKKLKAFSEGALQPYDVIADYFDFYDVKEAFEDGYTAGEQSSWRSVEELPEEYENMLVHCTDTDSEISDCIAYRKTVRGASLMSSTSTARYHIGCRYPPYPKQTPKDMTAEELTDFTIEQFNAIAEKKLTVQQTAKVLVSMVRIMTMQFPTDELKQRFLAEFADEILSLSPKNVSTLPDTNTEKRYI